MANDECTLRVRAFMLTGDDYRDDLELSVDSVEIENGVMWVYVKDESIVCHQYPNCDREHAGGAGGVPVHPPAGFRISGDEPLIPGEES